MRTVYRTWSGVCNGNFWRSSVLCFCKEVQVVKSQPQLLFTEHIFILIRMWHESGCSCCWWSQWHCQKLSLIAFFLSLNVRCLLELLLQLSKAAKTFPFCFPKFLHADTSVVSLQWQLGTYSICLFFSSFRDQVLHPQRCYVSYIARRN